MSVVVDETCALIERLPNPHAHTINRPPSPHARAVQDKLDQLRVAATTLLQRGCLISRMTCSEQGVCIVLHRAPGRDVRHRYLDTPLRIRKKVGGQMHTVYRARWCGIRVEWAHD